MKVATMAMTSFFMAVISSHAGVGAEGKLKEKRSGAKARGALFSEPCTLRYKAETSTAGVAAREIFRAPIPLWIRDLLGKARGAQQQILIGPGFVNGAFGVSVGGVAVLEFDRECRVEVAGLDAVTLDPHVPDARNLCGHLFHALERPLLVGVGCVGIPLDDAQMQHRLRLAKFILPGQVAAGEKPQRKQASSEKFSSGSHVNSHVSSL